MSKSPKKTTQTNDEKIMVILLKTDAVNDDLMFHQAQAARLASELKHHEHAINTCKEILAESEKKISRLKKKSGKYE